jgi:type IV pilus assembly protein PilA
MNNKKEKGFSLPELMVVVLIIAVLMAIAVPTYIGARDRAVAREAQSRLSNATVASKMLRSEVNIAFQSQTAAQLQSEAAPILFQLSIGTNPAAGSTTVVIYAQSSSGITFRTRDGKDRIWSSAIDATTGAVTNSGPF